MAGNGGIIGPNKVVNTPKTRTESLIDKQIQEYEKVIKKYKDNIVIRESTSVQKWQEISNEIIKELNDEIA